MPSLWAETLDEHRALVLGRLIDAYEDLRREVGVEGVTLAAVAKRAGLARSAVYNYVGDKHALILAHARRTLADAVDQLTAAVRAEEGAAGKLEAYVHHSMRLHASETGAGDDLMPMLTPEEQGALMGMLAPLRDLLDGIVARGVDDGTFHGDPGELVQVVWATLGGYRMPVAHGQVQADVAAATITRVLLGGMRAS